MRALTLRIPSRLTRPASVAVLALALALPAAAAVVFSTNSIIDYAIDDYIEITGSARVTLVAGGSITGAVIAQDTSVFHASDGSIGGTVVALDDSSVEIAGGTVAQDVYAGLAPDTGGGVVRVSGGAIAGILSAYDASEVHLSGGSVGQELRASYSGVAHVYGVGLRLEEINYPDYRLTGTLADGTPIDLVVGLFKGAQPGQIVLHDPGLLAVDVEDLVEDGALTEAQGRALKAKLNAATDALARGNANAAAGALRAFIREVEALVRTGRLSATEGAALIAGADAILAGLG